MGWASMVIASLILVSAFSIVAATSIGGIPGATSIGGFNLPPPIDGISDAPPIGGISGAPSPYGGISGGPTIGGISGGPTIGGISDAPPIGGISGAPSPYGGISGAPSPYGGISGSLPVATGFTYTPPLPVATGFTYTPPLPVATGFTYTPPLLLGVPNGPLHFTTPSESETPDFSPTFVTFGGSFTMITTSPGGTSIASGGLGGLYNGSTGMPLSVGLGVSSGAPGSTPINGVIVTNFGTQVQQGITENGQTGLGSGISFGSSGMVSGSISSFSQSNVLIVNPPGSQYTPFH
jgi:hypothetical protein